MPDTTALELLRHLAAADEELRPALLKHVSEVTQGLIDTTGRGMDLTEADLSNLDLRRVDLRRATLNRALLHGTRLQEADLSEVSMVCPGMERTNLTGASLRSAYVHALAAQTCVFDGADLTGLRDATGTLFHGCSMRGTHLDDGHLSGSSFYQCDLSDASMRNMNLQGALISECLLDSAALDGSCVDQLSVTKSSLRDTSLRSVAGHGLALQRLTAADGLVLADAGRRSCGSPASRRTTGARPGSRRPTPTSPTSPSPPRTSAAPSSPVPAGRAAPCPRSASAGRR